MKTITDDPEGFFDNGGWSFLDPESDVSSALKTAGQTTTVTPGYNVKVMNSLLLSINFISILHRSIA